MRNYRAKTPEAIKCQSGIIFNSMRRVTKPKPREWRAVSPDGETMATGSCRETLESYGLGTVVRA